MSLKEEFMKVRKHLNELYPTADISGYEKGIVKDYFYKIDEITGKRVKIF